MSSLCLREYGGQVFDFETWIKNQRPDPVALAGMALIIVSGIYIAYREIVNARRSIMPTAEASFAPGNPGIMPEAHEIDPDAKL